MTIKRYLITGASGGIGSEIAKALSQQGHEVIIQGRSLEKLTALQSSLKGNAQIILGDLTNNEEQHNILKEAFSNGVIDVLVNAAGVSTFSSFEDTQTNNISNVITNNLITPMQFCLAFIQQHKALSNTSNNHDKNSPVTIVNVGSAFGYIGYPGFSSYCASKFGLRGFTEALAREYNDSVYQFLLFSPRATKTTINTSNVDDLNNALGNTVDSPQVVAQQFTQFLTNQKRTTVLGWPEKLFVKVNALIPTIVDKAIDSKLKTIKKYFPTNS